MAQTIKWDWRLLASLIYHESRFIHDIRSKAGAYGIMQIMPSTADFLNIDKYASAEVQIIAGGKFLKYLDKKLPTEINIYMERVKFILASYNLGIGHILDAINLCEKYGENAEYWNNVKKYLLAKADYNFYSQDVVNHGYCKAKQTVRYVDQIIERYYYYRSFDF